MALQRIVIARAAEKRASLKAKKKQDGAKDNDAGGDATNSNTNKKNKRSNNKNGKAPQPERTSMLSFDLAFGHNEPHCKRSKQVR